MLLSIVVAIVILAVLIIVHEAGHFAMAKRLGVRVIRFSVGYPPKIWGIRRGETEYALGATPLGGYVRMLGDEVGDESGGEDLKGYLAEVQLDLAEALRVHGGSLSSPRAQPDELLAPAANRYATAVSADDSRRIALSDFGRPLNYEETALLEEINREGSAEKAIKSLCERHPEKLLARFRERAFPNQSLAKRFAIVLAGPLANIIFAPILLTIVFLYGVPYLKAVLGQVQSGMPAAVAGLKTGDRVVSIDGSKIKSWNDLSRIVKSSGGATLKIGVERTVSGENEHLLLNITPKREDEKTIYGSKAPVWVIGVLPRGNEGIDRVGPIRAVYRGFTETGKMVYLLGVGIGQIIDGATPVRQALGGPIMIAQMAGREAHQGLANVLMFTVMLSLELGIINLFPVPMLDGGHLLFFVCEGIRGKPLKLRHREIALQVGLLLLVALMAFVIFNDIARIVHS
ncbi:MAG: RIP metalloprotease RseP [Candidatus Binataceae bacterium]